MKTRNRRIRSKIRHSSRRNRRNRRTRRRQRGGWGGNGNSGYVKKTPVMYGGWGPPINSI